MVSVTCFVQRINMLAVIQRVTKGSVTINEPPRLRRSGAMGKPRRLNSIKEGYVILLGIFKDDDENDVKKLVRKIAHLRVMADEKRKMNYSIKDVNGEILVVSQFTLCADLTYGRRPSFIKAKKPEEAKKLYELFVRKLQDHDIKVKKGAFGEYMQVEIINDGPVTIIIDSNKL